MTLTQLAKEYRQSADKLKKRENEIKAEIKKGTLKNNIDTQFRLKTLREERYDAIKTAVYLENYYLKKENEVVE